LALAAEASAPAVARGARHFGVWARRPEDDASSESSDDESGSEGGDICGIIEADGLALEELPRLQGLGTGWRASVLVVQPPRPPVVEDEDGDLSLPRRPAATSPPATAACSSSAPPPRGGARGGGGGEGGVAVASAAAGLVGWRIEMRRLTSSNLEHVGLQLWAGALVLSDLLLARPQLVAGRSVCELGAGLGLCSLLAARLGAASVLCTDGSLDAVDNCQETLRLNGAFDQSCKVRAAVVEWEAPPPKPAGGAEGPSSDDDVGRLLWGAEILLAADVVYDVPGAEKLAALVDALLHQGSAQALYLAVEKRVYFSAVTLRAEVTAYPQFIEDCVARGLKVDQVDLLDVPVYFGYVRSRFYELVVITATPSSPSPLRKQASPPPQSPPSADADGDGAVGGVASLDGECASKRRRV